MTRMANAAATNRIDSGVSECEGMPYLRDAEITTNRLKKPLSETP